MYIYIYIFFLLFVCHAMHFWVLKRLKVKQKSSIVQNWKCRTPETMISNCYGWAWEGGTFGCRRVVMAKSPGSTHLNLACRWEYYIYIVYKESYIYNKISAVRLKKANGFPSVYAIFFSSGRAWQRWVKWTHPWQRKVFPHPRHHRHIYHKEVA